MLVIKNLSKSFGPVRAVDNLNFCLSKGEVTALLGPNGAGKTTLMRLISGFYEPDGGSVEINGYDLGAGRLSALRRFAYVPENGALYPELTVFEYLRYLSSLHGMPAADFSESLTSLLKRLDLAPVINQKCETLSKGFKRRVALAGALLHRPSVLIMDEPTEGLDPNQKYFVRRFIREYGRRSTVFISTHIMEEVTAMADRVILMNRGKLLRDTPPAELQKLSPGGDLETAFRTLIAHGDI